MGGGVESVILVLLAVKGLIKDHHNCRGLESELNWHPILFCSEVLTFRPCPQDFQLPDSLENYPHWKLGNILEGSLNFNLRASNSWNNYLLENLPRYCIIHNNEKESSLIWILCYFTSDATSLHPTLPTIKHTKT